MGLTFIASRTADEPGTGSGEATLSFTSGIDSTYNEYQFYYVNIHPETDDTHFQFQVETDGTDYDHPMITTYFRRITRNLAGHLHLPIPVVTTKQPLVTVMVSSKT